MCERPFPGMSHAQRRTANRVATCSEWLNARLERDILEASLTLTRFTVTFSAPAPDVGRPCLSVTLKVLYHERTKVP